VRLTSRPHRIEDAQAAFGLVLLSLVGAKGRLHGTDGDGIDAVGVGDGDGVSLAWRGRSVSEERDERAARAGAVVSCDRVRTALQSEGKADALTVRVFLPGPLLELAAGDMVDFGLGALVVGTSS
jgi:hypothetical protein